MSICTKWWEKFCSLWIIRTDEVDGAQLSNESLLKQADKELALARNMFSRVEDPEMVDCAIFTLKAAEKRYNYLFKKAKDL